MTKSEKVPKLRFREFSGEWQEKNLSGIVQFSRGGLLSKSDLNNDGKYKAIHYGQLFTEYGEIIRDIKSHTNVDSGKVSQVNDILMPTSDVTPQGLAKASVIHEEGVMLGGDINILQPVPGVFGDFLSYLLNSQKKKIMRLVTGTTVRHIYASDIKKAKYSIPDNKEQEKIAGFLGVVDEKIEQLQNKKNLLEKYKKGMMQKIFSQQIRFKDKNGKDYPDWEEKKLGVISSITTGKLDANAMTSEGQYRFYTCAKEYYKIDNYAFDTEALLVSGNGANVGYIHYYKGKFNAYQRTYVLDKFTENIFFVKQFLDQNLKKRIFEQKFEGNTPYIILSTLSDMQLPMPSREEQQKIAEFLTSLDDKIKLEESKLEQAKQFKKALLQQMFV